MRRLLPLIVVPSLIACSAPVPDAPPTPQYSGYTYDVTEADVIKRISDADASILTDQAEQITRDNGEACTNRKAVIGSILICSYEGKVSLIKYSVAGDGSNDAKFSSDIPVRVMMAALSDAPYTNVDKKRINRSVREILFDQQSVTERLDRGLRLVAMDIYAVAVEVNGYSYDLIADPNVSTVTDKTH